MLEDIVTDVRFTQKGSLIALRNHGSFFVDYHYIFNTRVLSESQQNATLNVLRNHSELKGFKTTQKDEPFSIAQITAPARIAKLLEGLFKKKFAAPHYTQQLREFVNPQTVVKIDEKLANALRLKAEFNKKISGFKPAKRRKIMQELEQGKEDSEGLKQLHDEVKRHSAIRFNNEQELEIMLSSTDGIIPRETPSMLTYEELMQQKWLFLDIEMPLYNHPDPAKREVSWVGLSYYEKGKKKKQIHTLSNLEANKHKDYGVITYSSQDELIKGVRESVLQEDPLFVSPFNAPYDLLKLREKSKEFTRKGTKTVKENSKKFTPRIGIRERQVIDIYKWARLALDHLPRKKLEVVARRIKGDFTKEVTYKQQAALEVLARKGDPHAARTIASYLSKDVDILVDIFESEEFQHILKIAAELAEDFHIPLTSLLDSPDTINLAQDRAHHKNIGMHRVEISREGEEFKEKRTKARAKLREMLKNELSDVVQPLTGTYTNVVKAYIPIGHHLRHLISKRFPLADKLYFRKEDTDYGRHFLAKYGNTLSYLMLDDFGDFYVIADEAIDYKHQVTSKIVDSRNPSSPPERLEKKKLKIAGNYGVTHTAIGKALWLMCRRIKRFAKQNNLKIIYHDRNYLYFTGANDAFRSQYTFDPEKTPVLKVDEIDTFEVSSIKGVPKQAYRKYGFYKKDVRESEDQTRFTDV